MPEAVTRNVRVHVESEFAPGRSSPAESKWFFLYTIRITSRLKEAGIFRPPHRWSFSGGIRIEGLGPTDR